MSTSQLPLRKRVKTLEMFWRICDGHKPSALAKRVQSFYETDNDRLLAGFSDVEGFTEGADVILWTMDLSKRLTQANVHACFGVYLVACGHRIDWRTEPGFPETIGKIYLRDEIYARHGRVVRSRLIGDCLIIAQRLVEVAKHHALPIALSTRYGGGLEKGIASLRKHARISVDATIRTITRSFSRLGPAKAQWLRARKIDVFGITFRKFRNKNEFA